MTFDVAEATDQDEIAALHEAGALALTSKYGQGPWSRPGSGRAAASRLKTVRVLIFREQARVIATCTLSQKKPWAIDEHYFHPVPRALYLTDMAVHPAHQRAGIGRGLLTEVERVARAWPAGAIRLDAWDSEAGGGGFYAKCGYALVGRASYRGTLLRYYERLLT